MDGKEAAEALRAMRKQDQKLWDEVVGINEYKLQDDDVRGKGIVDVGANIGIFTALCMSKGARRAVAVEPHPQTFGRLEANLAGVPDVICMQAALVPRRERTLIQGFSGNARAMPWREGCQGPEVRPVLLADLLEFWCGEPGFWDKEDLVLKMDVEGGEYGVLLGASSDQVRAFDTIFVETHWEKPEEQPKDLLLSYLKFMGFDQEGETLQCMWGWKNGVLQHMWPIPAASFRLKRRR